MPQNLSNLNVQDQAKMYLFKGAPASGKSPAAASFCSLGDIYFFDFDRRMSAVRKMFPNAKNIYYDTFTNYKKYADQMESLLTSCPYKTVVLDTVTNFVEVTMDYFIKLRGGGTTSDQEDKESKDKKSKAKSKGAVPLLMIDDYSAETRAISETLINLKYLAEEKKVNVIVIAHVISTTTTNIKTGSQTVEKFILTYGKKAAGKIPTLFDEIYHFSTQAAIIMGEPGRYLCSTESFGDDFARSSFHLPPEIDWTNRNFYELISPYFSEVKESSMDTSKISVSYSGDLQVKETSLTDGAGLIGGNRIDDVIREGGEF